MKRKIDKVFLIISIVIGIILGVVEEILYKNEIIEFNSRIPCITLYLFVFALILGIILLFKGLRNSTYVNFGKVMLLTLVATIAFVGCSALFEFLYELGGDKPKQHQASELQYVFLIDDSGSMDGNDPDDRRYDAVESIVRNLTPTTQFAVYTFENETHCLTPMDSTNSSTYRFNHSIPSSGGGTYMITAIEDAMKDVCGKDDVHTKVIALTDGQPSDDGFGRYSKLVRECVKEGVSVSSVGFGSPDESFLKELANSTGGTYVFSDNISSLTTNLETIVNAQTLPLGKNRDLLGYRLDSTYDSFLYGFLRVLFLILLGILWTIIKLLLVGERKFTQSSAVLSVILCSLAAILAEILLTVGLEDGPVRIMFCAMWACTLIPEAIYEKANFGNSLHSGQGSRNTGDLMNDFNTKSQEVGGPKSFL